MRFFGRCGCCNDETEVRGIPNLEQYMTVQYAFWANHQHTPEQVERARARAADMTDPANIPDWEREILGMEDGDDS